MEPLLLQLSSSSLIKTWNRRTVSIKKTEWQNFCRWWFFLQSWVSWPSQARTRHLVEYIYIQQLLYWLRHNFGLKITSSKSFYDLKTSWLTTCLFSTNFLLLLHWRLWLVRLIRQQRRGSNSLLCVTYAHFRISVAKRRRSFTFFAFKCRWSNSKQCEKGGREPHSQDYSVNLYCA